MNTSTKRSIIIGILAISVIVIAVFAIVHFSSMGKDKSDKGGHHKSRPAQPVDQNEKSKAALSYLSVVYPMVANSSWKSLSDEAVEKLYQSLCWYYTPMPLDVGTQSVILREVNGKPNSKQERTTISRRAPLIGEYYNISTEAYLTDGQDQVQILSAVHTGPAPGYKPDLSCTGSKIGFAGVMPNNKYFSPVLEDSISSMVASPEPSWIENFETSGSTKVDEWWPTYVSPDPANKLKGDDICGYSDICVDGQTAGVPQIPANRTRPNAKGGSNYCYGGVAGAFASAFPSAPMGPTWSMGAKPCTPDQLDFTGKSKGNTTGQPAVSKACIQNLFGFKNKIIGGDLSDTLKQAKKANRTSAKFQMVNIIQPYGRKQGCPNFGFMEGVAYVMEGFGRMLLNAPECSSGMSPAGVGALSRTVWCPTSAKGKPMKVFDRNVGKMVPVDMVECDPSNYGECLKSSKKWKDVGGIEYFTPTGNRNTYMPQKCRGGCCFSSKSNSLNNPNPEKIGTSKDVLDKSKFDAFKLALENKQCVQNPNLGSACTGKKIMFYWMNGYGKFINMGLTGVYSNYIGFLLSCPNHPWSATDPSKGPYLRRTISQINAMGLGGGAKTQLGLFTNGKGIEDPRQFLSGYVTTFQNGCPMKSVLTSNNYSTVLDKKVQYKYDFEATEEDWEKCVIIISGRMLYAKTWGPHLLPDKKNASVWKNGEIDASLLQKSMKNNWYSQKFKEMGLPDDMQVPPGLGNCQGLLNPQEGIEQFVKKGASKNGTIDYFLCSVAAHTVQCYYPPGLGIENPAYKKKIKLTPNDGALLWGAMYVLGDTGADWMGYNKNAATCAQVSKPDVCPSWPFGTYYFGPDIGACVYGLTAAFGWNSSQFSVMSTGGGGSKACDYPNYDYEIVYIGGSKVKDRVCKNSMKVGNNFNDEVYGFKVLDITGNGDKSLIDYYTTQNYVQGSTTGLTDQLNDLITCIGDEAGASKKRKDAFISLFSQESDRFKDDRKRYRQNPFTSCIMPLNEMNVHKSWNKNRANALWYNEPKGKCTPAVGKNGGTGKSLAAYQACEQKGGTASSWPFGITTSGASDCPYEDGKFGMRKDAMDNKVTSMFAHSTKEGNTSGDKHESGNRRRHERRDENHGRRHSGHWR